jgi:Transposase
LPWVGPRGVIEVRRVDHSRAGVSARLRRIAKLEPDAAAVRVVIEARHGLLVEALVDAGFTVVPVNPELVSRRRGPARKKDDAADARIACLLALDRHAMLKPLIPHGELAAELRAIARDDERAARDETRLLNRLRADLAATFPAALTLAGDDLGAPTVLRLLERYPTAIQLSQASRDDLLAVARASRHRQPGSFADKVGAALAADHFTPRQELARAKADTIQLAPVRDAALDALPLPVALHPVRREGARDASRLEWVRRVHQLEMQVRGGRVPTVADPPQHLAGADLLPSGDDDAPRHQVRVQRERPCGCHDHVVAGKPGRV